MKILIQTFIITIMLSATAQQNPENINLNKFSGKWFVIGVIPTAFDKNWEYVTETYTIKDENKIDIFTTYIKKGKTKTNSVRSKGFPKKEEKNVKWKVQFVWPFKADYLIEEIASDYSYTVVGHPKKKFLYIMNRSGKMAEELYNELVERYSQKGYETGKLQKVLQ